jgi:phosphatidylinositol kinase/protein kinase (PI-3  family)
MVYRILSAYFARSLHAADQWLHFRRELAGQVALASFLSFIMSIGDRGLHKLQISRSSARAQQLEFCPTYNDQYFAFKHDSQVANMTELLGPALLAVCLLLE